MVADTALLTQTLLAMCALAVLANRCQAVEECPPEFYQSQAKAYVHVSGSGATMPYRLYVPAGYDSNKAYPLVLSLHGAGQRGKDNLGQLCAYVAGWMSPQVQDKHPCFVLMPQCPDQQQWVDTPWEKGSYPTAQVQISGSMTLAMEILEAVRKQYSIDPSRLYVMGASMGGYGTWDVIVRFPDVFAAAVPVCGAGDPAMASKLVNVPIWAFHGDNDLTVPVSGTTDMVRAIQQAGGSRVRVTLYQGVGHAVCVSAWSEEGLVEWVFQQRLSM
jgi:predicted peptidase